MICPILSANPSLSKDRDCKRKDCAWWHDYEEGCSILIMSKSLGSLASETKAVNVTLDSQTLSNISKDLSFIANNLPRK